MQPAGDQPGIQGVGMKTPQPLGALLLPFLCDGRPIIFLFAVSYGIMICFSAIIIHGYILNVAVLQSCAEFYDPVIYPSYEGAAQCPERKPVGKTDETAQKGYPVTYKVLAQEL